MKSHTLFFFLIAGFALFSACTSGSGAATETMSFEHISLEKNYILKGSASDFDSDSDLVVQCRANLILPREIFGHDIDSLRCAILSAAFDSVKPNIDATITTAFTRVASESGYLPVETALQADYYDGAIYTECNISALTPKYAAFAISVSSYSPRSAHSDYSSRYVNYDMAQNHIIALSDLITPEGLESMPKILRRQAYLMRNLIGGTVLRTLPADNNFYISTAGDIVFAYQPYEIASYAQGEIQISIAPEQISDLLTPYATDILLAPR